MSYMRNSESNSPAPASEYFNSDTENGDMDVTLLAPQYIGNPTDTAGYITFQRTGCASAERDYFAAGQYKPWVVSVVFGADGGTSQLAGSTVRTCISGYNGDTLADGDGISTTTTTAGA